MVEKRDTPKRPRDMNQLAKLVTGLATLEAVEEMEESTDPKARKRGEGRAAKLTAQRRKEIARTAARARWGNAE